MNDSALSVAGSICRCHYSAYAHRMTLSCCPPKAVTLTQKGYERCLRAVQGPARKGRCCHPLCHTLHVSASVRLHAVMKYWRGSCCCFKIRRVKEGQGAVTLVISNVNPTALLHVKAAL